MSSKIRKGYLYSKAKDEFKSFTALFAISVLIFLIFSPLTRSWASSSLVPEPGIILEVLLILIASSRTKIIKLPRSLGLVSRFAFLLFVDTDKLWQDIRDNPSIYVGNIGENIEEIASCWDDLIEAEKQRGRNNIMQLKLGIVVGVLKAFLINTLADQRKSRRE